MQTDRQMDDDSNSTTIQANMTNPFLSTMPANAMNANHIIHKGTSLEGQAWDAHQRLPQHKLTLMPPLACTLSLTRMVRQHICP